MEGKKISFGFFKTKKVEKPVVEEKKDFIECLEEKSIKVVGGDKCDEEKPLVIPMKPNTLITAERLKEIAEKVESGLEDILPSEKQEVEIKLEPVGCENETLDQMAVRELLAEAKKDVKIEEQELTVPVPAKPVIDGEKESTLEDYESVPIQDFGMAMLRGMGWTAKKEQLAKYKQPQLRPKGLGLGADKVISDKQKKKASNKDAKEEELAIIKNSFVKIIAGKHSGYYGKVVSLDEDNGRVMVDITVKKETVSLSEFMMQPVTKAEFDKESKVINTGAFEEYKKKERSQNQNTSRNESPKVTEKQRDSPKISDREASSSQRSNDENRDRREVKEENRSKDYDNSSNGREKNKQERSRRDLSEDKDRSRRRKDYKRDSSSSEDRNKRTQKEKSRRDSSSSEERTSRRKKDRSNRDSSSEHRARSSGRKKEKSRRNSSSEDRSRRRKEKDKKRYSSNESLDSLSDSEKKKKHKNHRRRKDTSDSDSDTHKKDKRDIDKKRKGKKKKRDRDRSPNYKKHRK